MFSNPEKLAKLVKPVKPVGFAQNLDFPQDQILLSKDVLIQNVNKNI